MNSIVIALVAVALALIVQRMALRGHAQRLKLNEQAFKFHSLRDQLQSLAIQGLVDTSSELYDFMMFTLNVGIRNAGRMRLRDMLTMTSAVDRKRKETGALKLWRELLRSPEPVQRLLGDTFFAFSEMLIANDKIVWAGFSVALSTRSAIRQCVGLFDGFMSKVDPDRARMAYVARRYYSYGMRLAG